MDNAHLKECMIETLNFTLEEAFFVFTEEVHENPDWEDEVLVAELGFKGPQDGLLVLATSSGFASELHANLMGVEIDDPSVQSQGGEMVAETLNMISGKLVQDLFDGANVELGLPQLSTGSLEDIECRFKKATTYVTCFADMEHYLMLAIFMAN